MSCKNTMFGSATETYLSAIPPEFDTVELHNSLLGLILLFSVANGC